MLEGPMNSECILSQELVEVEMTSWGKSRELGYIYITYIYISLSRIEAVSWTERICSMFKLFWLKI